MEKLWYYGKNYGATDKTMALWKKTIIIVLWKKLWYIYYTENYGTLKKLWYYG